MDTTFIPADRSTTTQHILTVLILYKHKIKTFWVLNKTCIPKIRSLISPNRTQICSYLTLCDASEGHCKYKTLFPVPELQDDILITWIQSRKQTQQFMVNKCVCNYELFSSFQMEEHIVQGQMQHIAVTDPILYTRPNFRCPDGAEQHQYKQTGNMMGSSAWPLWPLALCYPNRLSLCCLWESYFQLRCRWRQSRNSSWLWPFLCRIKIPPLDNHLLTRAASPFYLVLSALANKEPFHTQTPFYVNFIIMDQHYNINWLWVSHNQQRTKE